MIQFNSNSIVYDVDRSTKQTNSLKIASVLEFHGHPICCGIATTIEVCGVIS